MPEDFNSVPNPNSIPNPAATLNEPPVNLPVDLPEETPPQTSPQQQPPFQPKPLRQFSSVPIQRNNNGPQPEGPPSPPPPPRPTYTPPTMPGIPEGPTSKPKRRSVLSVVVAILAIVIIFGLAAALYYYAVQNFQFGANNEVAGTPQPENPNPEPQPPVVTEPVVPEVVPTNVIVYSAAGTLPAQQKPGTCLVHSVAQPYREDAWRCMIGTTVYDPCFETSQAGLIICPMDLLAGNGEATLIKLSKPLPQLAPVKTIKENWAWLVRLEDGIFLSPFTAATKPFFDGVQATFGSKVIDGQRFVLMGELAKGVDGVWTAQKKTLTKQGATTWVTKSTETVKLDTVWQ